MEKPGVVEELVLILTKFQENSASDEVKQHCLQYIIKNWVTLLSHSASKSLLDGVIPALITELDISEPSFFEQTPRHHCRRFIVEILRRLALSNEKSFLKPYQASRILSSMFKAVEVDNEVNVIACLRVIILLCHHLKLELVEDTRRFLSWARASFCNIQGRQEEIYRHPTSIDSTEISEQGRPLLVINATFVQTPVLLGEGQTRILIPKGGNSLRVLQELPVVVLHLLHCYKELIQNEMDQLLSIVISTMSLHPTGSRTLLNKKVYLELMTLQVKVFTMVGHVVVAYQPLQQAVLQHGDLIITCLINLLKYCPHEFASVRRGLLIVARSLVKTPLVDKFVPHIQKMLDLELILGKGWSANKDKTVRTLAFQVVGELILHVKQELGLEDIIRAVHLAACQLLDDTNTLGNQRMFAKLLFPIAERLLQELGDNEKMAARDFLFGLMGILACKLKNVSLIAHFQQQKIENGANQLKSPEKFTLGEAQAFVKAIIFTAKNITWLIQGRRSSSGSQNPTAILILKPFSSEEVDIYVELMKWGLKAMEVYTGSSPQDNLQEKEVWKDFGFVFSCLNSYTFRQMCSICVETLVERLGANLSVQSFINNLFAQVGTSSIISSVLLEFLLRNVEALGGQDRVKSVLYLKLFKATFGALKLFPVENEVVMQQFFRQIVNKAIEFGLSSKKPLKYFQLLYELFNSTGRGKYEQLNQEFICLLPKLVKDLQRFRSCKLPQQLDELVISICLSFPAGLATMLPYMSLLMESTVAALNGSTSTLVNLGLRHLEMVVDSLDTCLLTEYLQPLHTELMQALWKLLRKSDQNSWTGATVFRILGKFGGINRKMLVESQKLKHNNSLSGEDLCVQFQFMDDHPLNINVPIAKVVETARKALLSGIDVHFKRKSWEILQGIVLGSLPKQDTQVLLSLNNQNFAVENDIKAKGGATMMMNENEKSRFVLVTALEGWLIATTVKEIRKSVYLSLTPMLQHLAMIMISQKLGMGSVSNPTISRINVYIVIDTLFNIFSSEYGDLRRTALFSLSVILNTFMQLLKTKENVFKLPLIDYIMEKLCDLCQEPAVKGKMGGCEVISFFLENAPLEWILQNHLRILKVMFYILADLIRQVSGDEIEAVKANIARLIQLVSSSDAAATSLSLEFLKGITSPVPLVRKECIQGLAVLANLQGKTVSEVVSCHMDTFSAVMCPLKKLLRHHSFSQQLGILDGTVFCLESLSQIYSLSWNNKEFQSFIVELLLLGETDDDKLKSLPSYICLTSKSNLDPLRIGIMKVLSSLTDLPNPHAKKVINMFFLHLGSSNAKVQKVAFESLKKFKDLPAQTPSDLVKNVLKQSVYPTLTIPVFYQLCYLNQLFPDAVKNWSFLVVQLRKFLELAIVTLWRKPNVSSVPHLDLCMEIFDCFQLLKTNTLPFIEPLLKLTLHAEKNLCLGEENSPFRKPLIKFLNNHPPDSYVNLILSTTPSLIGPVERYRFLIHLIQAKDVGLRLRTNLMNNPERLVSLLNDNQDEQIRFLGVKALITLSSYDESWISGAHGEGAVKSLRKLWTSEEYQLRNSGKDEGEAQTSCVRLANQLKTQRLEELEMIVKLLLSYFRKNASDFGLLFQLLLALCGRPKLTQFEFLKEFLEYELTKYSTSWKRGAFLKFIQLYKNSTVNDELKAKVLEFVLIPCFARAFEENEGAALILGQSQSATNRKTFPQENVVHVLINEMFSTEHIEDELRIGLIRLCCLLIDKTPQHFHKDKVTLLEAFVWPSITSVLGCVDPFVKYYAHLLLSHLCAKYPMNKLTMCKVFTNLLKASDVTEPNEIVNEALDVITTAFSQMGDGYVQKMLFGYPSKMLTEGCTTSQLAHILQLIVRQSKIYYEGRLVLVRFGKLVDAVTRLGLSGAEEGYRMIALDVAETVFDWEISSKNNATENKPVGSLLVQQPLLRFVMQMSCQDNTEISKRSMSLLNRMLQPKTWGDQLSHVDFSWMKNILISAKLTNPPSNFPSICKCLELIVFTIGQMNRAHVLQITGLLHEGIISCVTISPTRPDGKDIQAAAYKLLAQVMGYFPPVAATPGYDELTPIYRSVLQVICNGLTSYQNAGASQDQLVPALMMLKIVCSVHPRYIDLVIIQILTCLEKLSEEHLMSSSDILITPELLISALNLVETMVPLLVQDVRETVLVILVRLIEKSICTEVLECVIEMIKRWMQNEGNLKPTEFEILLVKLMENVEPRFPKEEELLKSFLDLVSSVYQVDVRTGKEKFRGTDLWCKLQPAFLRGLRHAEPKTRKVFSKVFCKSIKRQVYERLLYIVSYQNWEGMGTHYWIKQCLELLFSTVLPGQLKIIPKLVVDEKQTFVKLDNASPTTTPFHQEECQPLGKLIDSLENMDISDESAVAATISKLQDLFINEGLKEPFLSSAADVETMLKNDKQFISRSLESLDVLHVAVEPILEMCHLDTELAESLWISLLPKLWKALSRGQQQALGNEIQLFLKSGAHLPQQHCSPSALNTFFETVNQFTTTIPVQPVLLYHLGKTHNLWHRSALVLEQLTFYTNGENGEMPSELCDSLSLLYSELGEEDLWAGHWQRVARIPETGAAIALRQQGNHLKARETFELAMPKVDVDDDDEATNPLSVQIGEAKLLDEQWLKCAQELNEWDMVQEYTASEEGSDTLLHLEASWKKGDWTAVRNDLSGLEQDGCARENQWKVELIRGYMVLFSVEENLGQRLPILQRLANYAQSLCVTEWKRLPELVSSEHIRVLQAIQQVVELREAVVLQQSLLANRFCEVEQVVSTWENRMPSISDELSHWSEILSWRSLNYQFIASQTKVTEEGGDESDNANKKLFGVHASAQAIVQFAKIARKHGLLEVALEALNKVYTFPMVPANDCFENLMQQAKCYLQEGGSLQYALGLLEESDLTHFKKDDVSEILALKGLLHMRVGEGEVANKVFSVSCQLNPDRLGKNWGYWAEYLEQQCFQQPNNSQKSKFAVSAVTGFLKACQIYPKNEAKSRKYIAKVLWLLDCVGDEKGTVADSVTEICEKVSPIHWIIWIPQLLNFLVQKGNEKLVTRVLNHVGEAYPEALYFPLRTLYLTLKAEERGKLKKEEFKRGQLTQPTTIKATPSMWRCSKIMQIQRTSHPVLLSTLEGIAEELTYLRETWVEELLKKIRPVMASCCRIAFENRSCILDMTVTQEVLALIQKLSFTFRAHEVAANNPAFLSMKTEFLKDFGNAAVTPHSDLLSVIHKVVKWIKIFENEIRASSSKIAFCEERGKLLLSFNADTAEIGMPGECLIPKASTCSVKIARFEAKLDVVVKPQLNGKRLFIRGHNGKVYPYLVISNKNPTDWEGERGEERVLQVLRMLNHYLEKQKGTTKRSMRFMVPKVVAVSPQIRLVEDNPKSLSLLEAFKLHCSKQDIDINAPVLSYYEKLCDIQRKEGTNRLPSEALLLIYQYIQKRFAPQDLLKNWAVNNYVTLSDYWMFRKTFTSQLCLNNLASYVFSLTSLSPKMMNIHQDTGLVNISYFKFEIDSTILGKSVDSDQRTTVAFRLTPNLVEFLSQNGVNGPLVFGMMAVAKCLVYPNYKLESILRPVLKNEMMSLVKQKNFGVDLSSLDATESTRIIKWVNKTVDAMMTRLTELSVDDVRKNNVKALAASSTNVDNLCRMDPTLFPWL